MVSLWVLRFFCGVCFLEAETNSSKGWGENRGKFWICDEKTKLGCKMATWIRQSGVQYQRSFLSIIWITYPLMTSLLPPCASTGNHLIIAHCSCKPIQRIPHLDPNCYNINMSENGSFTGQVTATPQMNGRNLSLLSLPCLAWKKVWSEAGWHHLCF